MSWECWRWKPEPRHSIQEHEIKHLDNHKKTLIQMNKDATRADFKAQSSNEVAT